MKNYFASNLKTLLMKKQMSQSELAKKLGVTSQSISRYTTGVSYPTLDTLMLLKEIFGYSLDELVTVDLALTTPLVREPLKEYEKTQNVDKLIQAISELTEAMKEKQG